MISNNHKIENNANLKQLALSLIEIFVVIGVAIIFYFPLASPPVSIIVSTIGGLLVINRVITHYLTKEIFKDTENSVSQIAKVTDIRNDGNVDLISKLLEVYLKITEPEFGSVKNRIVNDSIKKLNKLKNDKHSDELQMSEYYHWLFPILESIQKGESIKAVSCMFDAEWDDSPAEQRFIEGNLNAASKGAIVERVFIMKKELLKKAMEKEAVKKHAKEKRIETKLIGYFAEKEKLEREEPDLLKNIGDGFIIFNSRVALVDKFDTTGNIVRGVVTMNEDEIHDMEHSFQRLKIISRDISESMKI